MELFKLLHFFTFLSLAIVASQADPDDYWKSKLPNTRMPKSVRDLLHNDWLEDKSTSVLVGKGGVNVNTGMGKGKGTHVTVHKGHPVHVGVTPYKHLFDYFYAANKDQLHDDPNVALFFLEKDLHSGTAMNLHFPKSPYAAGFLPRKIADSIPFSSEHVPEILNLFDFKPESAEAKVLKNTINECEQPGIKGEEKYCATSLESMVDFSTSELGKHVEAVSTEVQKETKSFQKYKIVDVKKLNGSGKAVVCHKMDYAYAVFLCHGCQAKQTTEAYAVYLVGADGTKAKALAICHKDTAAWNPKHLAFQVLKVKPGTVPVCHFLPEDTVVWVSN